MKRSKKFLPLIIALVLMDGKGFKHNVGHKELEAWVDGLKL